MITILQDNEEYLIYKVDEGRKDGQSFILKQKKYENKNTYQKTFKEEPKDQLR